MTTYTAHAVGNKCIFNRLEY